MPRKGGKALELLAPAGNINKLKTALAYGADAVYLGVPEFSLRVRINDFNLKTLEEAVAYAHRNGKRAYVTLNIFAHEKHLKALPDHIKALRRVKPDALIISDPGLISLIKKHWPQASIHLSTQANCGNSAAAKFWAAQGIDRIILGRETTLEEIREIRKALPKKVELEYFVHGAMCMAYSGRCFLSKMFTARSGNLGDCAQPCRWQYDVAGYGLKAKGHDEELELVQEEHGSYLLNSRDLCLIKRLPELIAAGITSFKIEGRAKSDHYLATVCGAYRRALDNPEARGLGRLYRELDKKLIHRGYTEGFLMGGQAEQNTANANNKSAYEFCGQVVSVSDGLRVRVHNTIKCGDRIEIIGHDYDIIKTKVGKISDAKTGEELQEAHGGGGNREIILGAKLAPGQRKSVFPLSVLRRLK